jgi:RNA polymerase sigma factor (sigma-70 family)
VGVSWAARSDADLVREARYGGPGARQPLAELLGRHWDTAAFLCARVLRSPDLAADAVQEAAIAAMTNLDRLRSPDRFGAWFCGIALNVSRRWLRQLRAEVPGAHLDQPSAAPGPAEAAELADLASRVRRAVAQLPAGQRDAVLLFYLQGLSHREVATELGISPGAVKARLHQARASLAPKLAPMVEQEQERTVVTQAGTTAQAQWVDVFVSAIRQSPDDDYASRKHIMILTERDGDRWLPMWIGPAEATALSVTLDAAEMPRPFTYKLAAALVEAADATVTEVRITKLEPPVFFASVLVRGAGGLREVDARPSDAVNVALATGAPIRINGDLLDAPKPDAGADLETYPVVTTALAAEVRERQREALASLPRPE